MDGIQSHHFRAPIDARSAEEVAGRVGELAVAFDPAAVAALHDQLAEQRALGIVDGLTRNLREGDMPREGVRRVSRWLCEHGWRREPVKIGIAMLGEVAEEPDRERLLLLGALDELTLYAAVALAKTWSYRGVFELARRVDGWGRIHAVERLKGCEDPGIRAWLLREGFRNGVMNEYLAGIAATTGDLYVALSDLAVDDALLDGAGDIFLALATGGPAEDLRHYPDALPALDRYLDLVAAAVPSLPRLSALTGIARILRKPYEGLDWPDGERERVAARIDQLLTRPAWGEVARACLADPADEYEFNRALASALHLGLPVRAEVVRHLRKHPNNAYVWQSILPRATAADVPELLAVAEEVLPLDALATGPGTTGGWGGEFEQDRTLGTIVNGLREVPGVGLSSISTALSNRVVWVRRAAVETLSAWAEAAPSQLPLAAIGWVREAAAREPDENLRTLMRDFLGSHPRRAGGV
jgi:hypothetical protein